MRVIIAGSRDFNDYELLKNKVNRILSNYQSQSIEIVSGGARGADRYGERFAKEYDYRLKRFPADWNAYGKKPATCEMNRWQSMPKNLMITVC
jgi:hypothetical protein